MKTAVIIQARMSSSRLPGKVMLDIAGKPMLGHVIERISRVPQLDSVWVATTIDPSDDLIETYCDQVNVPCFRGSMFDVLDRYYHAAIAANADIIVRVTADCPLIDPRLVTATLDTFLQGADFAANRLPPPWTRTFPVGLDTEICSLAALERAWKEADRPYHREHVFPYLYEGVIFTPEDRQFSPGMIYVDNGISQRGFHINQLHHYPDHGALRWTVDTLADLELVRRIFSHFVGAEDFSWMSILQLFHEHPELTHINAEVQHKTAFDIDSRMN